MLHIAVVDDETLELERTAALIERWGSAPSRLAAFSSARSLLAAMDAGARFDLYLLDVVMPEMDGIELGRAIRERDESGAIVYLTTAPDFALDSFAVWPLQYLLKPVEPERLFEALDRVASLQKQKNEGTLVHTVESDVFLPFDDILYAEKYGRCVRYVCRERVVESVSLCGPFREAVEPLTADGRFLLCGANLAVNLSALAMVDKEGAVFSGGARLALTKTPCATLRAAWLRHYLKGGGEA